MAPHCIRPVTSGLVVPISFGLMGHVSISDQIHFGIRVLSVSQLMELTAPGNVEQGLSKHLCLDSQRQTGD